MRVLPDVNVLNLRTLLDQLRMLASILHRV